MASPTVAANAYASLSRLTDPASGLAKSAQVPAPSTRRESAKATTAAE